MRLKLTWPDMTDAPLRENFFFGGWHPNQSLRIEWTEPPVTVQPTSIHSKNWFLVSTVSLLHPAQPGLLHVKRHISGNQAEAVAFRGYLLEPPFHSYSSSQTILNYWFSSPPTEHNGVFAAACIRDAGKTLELITDAFGMAPLYYRLLGEVVLFATNPKFLTTRTDAPDYMAWRALVQAGFIPANRTLWSAIKRVPSGQVLRFHQGRRENRRWFDYETLPTGTQTINDAAVTRVENTFEEALSQCLRLTAEGIILPLSSGYDSRRILIGLLHRNVPFQALTVRMLEKKNRDLDMWCTSLMAKELGFAHRIVEYPFTFDSWEYAREYARDDYQRRIMCDAEARAHTWAISLMRSLPDYPTIFFDGVAGDALGESGFSIANLHDVPDHDKQLIAHYAIGPEFDTILNHSIWPSADDIRHEIIADIESLPSGLNQAEMAFLLLHTRRATAIATHQMLSAGHVVVCPYLELNYLRTLLSYHPAEKYQKSFQRRCLETFWPQHFAYPGSRNIPPDMPPGPPGMRNKREISCFRQLQHHLIEKRSLSELQQRLSPKANLQLWLVQKSDRMALRMMWAFRPIIELVTHNATRIACWSVLADD